MELKILTQLPADAKAAGAKAAEALAVEVYGHRGCHRVNSQGGPMKKAL